MTTWPVSQPQPTFETSRLPTPFRKHQLQLPRRRREIILHLPQERLPAAHPRRECHVVPTQQCGRHGPDLHQRQVLAHAAEPSLEEGRKGPLVAHEVGFRVPALGDEVQRALEAGGEAVQGVDGEAEHGGAGDGGGGYGYAFGGGFAEAAGRDGRVQA